MDEKGAAPVKNCRNVPTVPNLYGGTGKGMQEANCSILNRLKNGPWGTLAFHTITHSGDAADSSPGRIGHRSVPPLFFPGSRTHQELKND